MASGYCILLLKDLRYPQTKTQGGLPLLLTTSQDSPWVCSHAQTWLPPPDSAFSLQMTCRWPPVTPRHCEYSVSCLSLDSALPETEFELIYYLC